MPYIKTENRKLYDEVVESVVEICRIADVDKANNEVVDTAINVSYKMLKYSTDGIHPGTNEWKGNLNYLISKLCHELIKANGLRYHNVNDIIGILRTSDSRLNGWSTTTDWKDVLKYFIRNLLLKIAFNSQFLEDELAGVMECCKLELYAMVARPYEDKKKLENGSVSELDDISLNDVR